MQRARFRGEWVRFLTLTAPPEGMSMSDLYSAWNRLRTTLPALNRSSRRSP
jgi:hypothetical protein